MCSDNVCLKPRKSREEQPTGRRAATQDSEGLCWERRPLWVGRELPREASAMGRAGPGVAAPGSAGQGEEFMPLSERQPCPALISPSRFTSSLSPVNRPWQVSRHIKFQERKHIGHV